jgi:hypothetical protein
VTNDVIHRLALACAHGIRQKALVEELLNGTAYVIPDKWGMRVGKAQVDPKSYQSLCKRLVANGFKITRETYANKTGKYPKIEMKFEMNFSSR